MTINPEDSHQCYQHDMSGDANWWDEHIGVFAHKHVSSRAECKDCGVTVEDPEDYKGKLHNKALHPVYCEECKERLLGDLNG